MVSARTRETIEAVLRSVFADMGYVGAEIVARPNEFGDPALSIVPRFSGGQRVPPVRRAMEATSALHDALLEIGDERFPYLDYDYPTNDEAAA